MSAKIRILKNSVWYDLILDNPKAVKYNAVINRIGKIQNREISHTNTFKLPYVSQNIEALDLNMFNPVNMALALNKKYVAKYYVDEALLQSGFIVINNTKDNKISVNFIDEALSLTEKWSETTFYDLVFSAQFVKPTDYQTVIDNIKEYPTPLTGVIAQVPDVGARGYKFALFPNNLNVLGDKFQVTTDGGRVLDSFNPYQSRPIFSVKSLFDLAVETFGYTMDWGNVDVEKMKTEFIVSRDLRALLSTGIKFKEISSTGSNNEYASFSIGGGEYLADAMISTSTCTKPNDVTGWVDPPLLLLDNDSYKFQDVLYTPDITVSNDGLITITSNLEHSGTFNWGEADVFSAWRNPSSNVVFGTPPTQTEIITSTNLTVTLEKSDLVEPEAGCTFIGILVNIRVSTDILSSLTLTSTLVTEIVGYTSVAEYDEYDQYAKDEIDLTHAVPKDTMRVLLSGYMEKEGILMNIDTNNNTVYLFTYSQYRTKANAGTFENWSNYLLENAGINYDTDYGNSYARVNKIGLKEFFSGNTNDVTILPSVVNTKYKSFVQNNNKTYKDVSKALYIQNTTPFIEYTNTGLGLIEKIGDLTGLDQINFDKTIQGTISSLPEIANVNYSVTPDGLKDWYKLVEQAVRVTAKFLIPSSVMRYLDLSKPIYVEQLGGFFIIEEIKEYSNAQTPVNVNLIKLIDNF